VKRKKEASKEVAQCTKIQGVSLVKALKDFDHIF
jgi:hypothetical protein